MSQKRRRRVEGAARRSDDMAQELEGEFFSTIRENRRGGSYTFFPSAISPNRQGPASAALQKSARGPTKIRRFPPPRDARLRKLGLGPSRRAYSHGPIRLLRLTGPRWPLTFPIRCLLLSARDPEPWRRHQRLFTSLPTLKNQ